MLHCRLPRPHLRPLPCGTAPPASPQLPDSYYWELQYRPLIPGASQPAGWQTLEVGRVMEVEVTGLEPGTRYAFRHAV